MKTNINLPACRMLAASLPNLALQARSSHLLQVAALLLALVNSSRAQVVPFKMETPLWYVQVGVVVNPAPSNYVFAPPAGPGLWCTPAEMIVTATSVTARDYPLCPGPGGVLERTRHDSAPHADDVVPATAWAFDIACPFPPSFGARETRVRGSRSHPASHSDHYMAVVGAMRGTVPGPSVAPRSVAIHGSMGKHMDSTPVKGSSRLEPPSGQPSIPNQDYPMGEVLTMADTNTSELLMLVVLDGVTPGQIGSVVVRQGRTGSALMDLRPMMQVQVIDTELVALSLQSVPVSHVVIDLLASGEAFLEVQTSAHPDGKIVGSISSDAESKPGIQMQGGNVLVTRNGPGYLQCAGQLGQWNRFASVNPLVETTVAQRFYSTATLPGWDFDGDGKDDLIRTGGGLGYDVGGGSFVHIPGVNWIIDVKPNGFDVKIYDGEGNLVKTYTLRDLNGDGDFSEAGEVVTVP